MQRHHHQNRGEDVHQRAHQQQSAVQQQQEKVFGLDVRLHPVDQFRGHLGINQVIGEAQRDTHDQQDAAHDGGALDKNFAGNRALASDRDR